MNGPLVIVPGRRIPRLVLAAICLTAVAVTALDDAFMVYEGARQMRLDGHTSILAHTANAPDRYRVLVPYVVEGAIRVLARVTTYQAAFDTAYAAFYMLGFAWSIWMLFAYLRVWFTEEQALVGALAAASTLRLTLQEYTPFSVVEPGCVALALILSYRQRRGWLAVLVAIASLNRETAVFLPMLYALTSPINRRNVLTSVALFAVWASVFIGIRYVTGDAYRYWNFETVWAWNRNAEHLALGAQNVVLLLGAFWLFAVLGFRKSSSFVQRSALVIPPYLATVMIWGVWTEVRLLTTLYPIVFSLALSYLFTANAVRRTIVVVALLASVAGLNAYYYSFLVPQAPVRGEVHRAVIDHSADGPERFRVLVPYIVEAAARPVASVMPHDKAVSRLYAAYYLVALTAMLFAHFAYFNVWFSRELALVGSLFIADTIRIALRQGEYIAQAPLPRSAVFAPHSLLEPTLIAVALLLIVKGRWRVLIAVVIAAALNSEAALLLPLLVGATDAIPHRRIRTAFTCAAVAASVLILIRFWAGGAWFPSIADVWQANTTHLATAGINVLLFLGGVWVLAGLGYTHAQPFLRRAAEVGIPAVALAVGLWGLWWDVRLLMPIYALVVPLALSYLSGWLEVRDVEDGELAAGPQRFRSGPVPDRASG